MFSKASLLTSILIVFCSQRVTGHGFMYMPPNRASLWRLDRHAPINYDDNAYNCGGFSTQHWTNDGNCGPCGDDWRDPVPRSNENGGFYGRGGVLVNYTTGQIIEVHSLITSNHLGSLSFSLCKLEDLYQPETEECFQSLTLADGTTNHPISAKDYKVISYVQLPSNVTCEKCVLRWHYKAGNNWGVCEDGTQKIGCGIQETFRSCADILINQMPDASAEASPFKNVDENYSHLWANHPPSPVFYQGAYLGDLHL